MYWTTFTRSKIARHLLVWAYHEWCVRLYVRRAYEASFFPEISSQNTAAFCMGVFPVSRLGTPGTFGAKPIHLTTKYDEERLAFLDSSFLRGSYGSSNKKS